MAEEDYEAPVPLIVHVKNNLLSNFSNVKVYINKQQIDNFKGLCAHKYYLSNNFKGPSPNTRELCTGRCATMKNFLTKLRSALVWAFLHKNESA